MIWYRPSTNGFKQINELIFLIKTSFLFDKKKEALWECKIGIKRKILFKRDETDPWETVGKDLTELLALVDISRARSFHGQRERQTFLLSKKRAIKHSYFHLSSSYETNKSGFKTLVAFGSHSHSNSHWPIVWIRKYLLTSHRLS